MAREWEFAAYEVEHGGDEEHTLRALNAHPEVDDVEVVSRPYTWQHGEECVRMRLTGPRTREELWAVLDEAGVCA